MEKPLKSGEEGGEATSESTKIAAQLMKNPQVLAALQDKLGSTAGSPTAFLHSLPKVVQRRIKALKKLQNDVIDVEAQFYREVHELECKYAASYTCIFEKRSAIVRGRHEPSEEECDWPSDEEKEEDDDDDKKQLADELKKKATVTDAPEEEEKSAEDIKGVPGFWLTIFKNVDLLQEMVQPHDEPILNHLQDIRVRFSEEESKGFTLEFHFEPNEFFPDTVLTKQYTMRFEQDTSDPFSYEGPEIVKCVGCPIAWNKGKNVTVKLVKKKQKHRGKNVTRTVTKTVQNDSFFNFFAPPDAPGDESDDDLDEDMEALLAADFEIGHFIRDRIIPRAVLYFTGEAMDSEGDCKDCKFEDDEGEEEDEEGDFDEENEMA